MKINLYELVRRHNPVISEFDALTPLTDGKRRAVNRGIAGQKFNNLRS
jgi:hypothetical protein